jgi:hypothetical protein
VRFRRRPSDTRIRRQEFVGERYGPLLNTLVDGMYAALGGAPSEHLDRLNAGQRAIVVLTGAFGYTYGDGLESLYEYAPDLASEAPAAARHVGADALAAVFERAGTAFARGDEDAVESINDEIYALEDAGEVVWQRMLSYVEAHPDEFFRD